jgi:multicomponent Na+:H+ antiporter subunit D
LVLVREHGVIALQMGGWEAPFGITLVVDYLSALMLVVSAIIIFSIAVFALRFLPETIKLNRFFIFFFGLTMGLNGAFVTGDVFNLFVWFEVMLMSSFVLITLGRTKNQLEGGIKYLALNLVGSMFFLAGVGLLYGKTGTLNMAHLAEILKNDDQAILMNTSAVLFFVAFGIKAAVFPLYFWLPASYHTPNITISSLFAGLLTKVGVYTFIRFFTLFCARPSILAPAFACYCRPYNGGRWHGGGGTLRNAPDFIIPHHQPDWIHDNGAGHFHTAGHCRCGVFYHPQHGSQNQYFPGFGDD